MKRFDLNWALVIAGLIVAVPFAINAVYVFKTGRAPGGWIFDTAPGVGMGLVMLIGQAKIARAAVTLTEAPRWIRAALAGAWAIVFGCMMIIMPFALYAGALNLNVPETVDHIAAVGIRGWVTLALYATMVLAVEGLVGPLLVASWYERSVDAGRSSTAREAMSSVRKGTAAEAVINALTEGPKSLDELKIVCEFRGATVEKAARDLVSRGHVVIKADTWPETLELAS